MVFAKPSALSNTCATGLPSARPAAALATQKKTALDTPKSPSFTAFPLLTNTLDGLMSLCEQVNEHAEDGTFLLLSTAWSPVYDLPLVEVVQRQCDLHEPEVWSMHRIEEARSHVGQSVHMEQREATHGSVHTTGRGCRWASMCVVCSVYIYIYVCIEARRQQRRVNSSSSGSSS